jgi:hypothetical protein
MVHQSLRHEWSDEESWRKKNLQERLTTKSLLHCPFVGGFNVLCCLWLGVRQLGNYMGWGRGVNFRAGKNVRKIVYFVT